MKTPMVSSATSFQRLQTSLQSPMPRLPRSNVYSTQDPANPSASVHRKRFFTPSLTLKFLCAGYLNRGGELWAWDQGIWSEGILLSCLVGILLFGPRRSHSSIPAGTRVRPSRAAAVKDGPTWGRPKGLSLTAASTAADWCASGLAV